MPRREMTLRDSVIRALSPLHAIAVENPILPGTPDVNFVEGWIELKSWEYWPKKPYSCLRIDHWTPQQRVWHLRRSRVGGRTYVLLEVVQGHHYLLLDGGQAARMLGKLTRSQLESIALARWEGKKSMKAGLLELLRSPHVDPRDPDVGPGPGA